MGVSNTKSNISADVYPNPANNETNIVFAQPIGVSGSYTVTDVKGTVVASGLIERGAAAVGIDVSNMVVGVYAVHITAGKYYSTKKLSVVK